MPDSIQIDLDEVREKATVIKSCNDDLTDRLEEITRSMEGLVDSWESEAATTIFEKFKGLKPVFEDYEKVVEAYAQFLMDTAETYDQTDSAISSNASQFN